MPMTNTFHIRVSKDNLVFSAAHFITIGDNICERLHGHNYRVAAEVLGPLDQNSCVVDFIALRDTLQDLIAQLDHYVLLPTKHPAIHVVADDQSVVATFADRRWEFPRGDCVLLPVVNTTAERLAEYLAGRLLDELRQRYGIVPQRLVLEVDECFGQIGICECGRR
jgi:6-pyruvoyltetrahydropterin/6-carboxytetrahydropterin synthase